MDKRSFLLALAVVVISAIILFAEGQAWDDTNYRYRKPLLLIDTAGRTLTDFTTIFNFTTVAGHHNSNFSDIKVYCGGTQKPIYQKWNTTAWTQFVTRANSNVSTCYVYYGYATDTGVENKGEDCNAAYKFCDISDDSSLNSSLWGQIGANDITISGGYTYVDQTSAAKAGINSTIVFGQNTSIEIINIVFLSTSKTTNTIGYAASGTLEQNMDRWSAWGDGNFYVGTTKTGTQTQTSKGSFAAATYYNLSVFRNGNNVTTHFFKDGAFSQQHTTNIPTVDEAVTIYSDTSSANKIRFHKIYVSDQISPAPVVSLGAEEENTQTSVTAITPSGISYSMSNGYSFYYNSSLWISGECWISPRNNGTWDYIGNATNGTLTSGTFVGIAGSSWTFNLTCASSGGNLTTSTNYSIVDYAYLSEAYQTQDYETNTSLFSLNINASERLSGITATLSWNGTATIANASNVGSEYRFNFSQSVPLLTTNTSIVSFWNYTLTWLNGTVLTTGTTPRTISLNQSYVIAQLNNTPSIVIEGDEIIFQTRITKSPVNGGTISKVYFTLNNEVEEAALLSSASTYEIWELTTFAPAVSGSSVTFYNSTATFTFGTTTLNKTSTTTNYSVYFLEFTNCGAGTNSTTEYLRFTSVNEESLTAHPNMVLNLLINIAKNTISKVYNFTFSGNYSYPICVYPPNSTVSANATVEYDGTGYSQRDYFLVNAELRNVSTNVNLYLLNDSSSTEIVFYIKDASEQPLDNIVVLIQRNYLELNSFLTVAMGLTDAQGAARINLYQSKNLYKVILMQEGEIIKTIYPVNLIGESITFRVTDENPINYYEKVSGVSWDCYFNEGTSILVCEYADASGLMSSATLTASKMFAYVNKTINTTTAAASSGTLYLALGNISGQNVLWQFKGDFSGDEETLASGILEYSDMGAYVSIGVFLGFGLIVVFAALGLAVSPAAGIIGALGGLIMAYVMGFFAVGLESIIILVVVAGLFIGRLSR